MTHTDAPDPFGKKIPRQRNPKAPRGVPPIPAKRPGDPFFFDIKTVVAAPVRK